MRGAHIVVCQKNGKKVLEIGHDEANILKKSGNFCLTSPWTGGSLNRPHSGKWQIWDLKNKDLGSRTAELIFEDCRVPKEKGRH